MAGRASQSWCPSCHTPPGPDCPDVGRSPRQIRRQLARELATEVTSAVVDTDEAVDDQAWFWTPEWQAGEREADEDLAAGKSAVFLSEEEFVEHLERIPLG